jgi:RNA-directed DNA polymerase
MLKEGLNQRRCRSMKVTESGNLKHRQLRFEDYLQRVSAEQREDAEVCEPSKMTETDSTNTEKQTEGLLERILSKDNLNRAYKQVKRNKGAGGIDGMQVDELLPFLKENKNELVQSLRDGKYRPKPVRRVEIPKENGKTRKLGVPTVVDRLIQQAICQVLSPIFEKQFSDNSFGFRPKRSAHDALKRCQTNITEGYRYVVDMDLEKYFDTVNQSKLIQILSETIKDGRVISLIHKFLRAGVMVGRVFEDSPEGVPQGGPLSPLLGNIMLNECDHELERRGHRFVRYADDMLVFCKSKKAANRTLNHILPYIEGKLFLKVNREKTQVAHVNKVKYLGYSFYISKGEGRLRIHPKIAVACSQRAKSTRSPLKHEISTFGRWLTDSFSIAIRSSRVKRGSLSGFLATATISLSNSPAPRSTISRWPLVTGSKLPGYIAIFIVASSIQDCGMGLI